ncbi:MAG: ZIP family metal transporter [Halodesulfurarchaeum sp.]
MDALGWILLTTFLISLLAWIGILTLFLTDELLDRILLVLVALAAGALIGSAFLHLLPRAIQEYGAENTIPMFLYLIAGFCLFYVLEQFIHWHHHHGATHDKDAVSYLVLISDTVHNFIDGLVIAGSFLVGVDVGLVTAAAIALHEIPQEIGDFGVLVYGGFERFQALVLNYLTQATVIVGGLVGYGLASMIDGPPTFLLPFAAGTFIYIASSDLIPEIKHETDHRKAAVYFVVFLTGILLMYGIKVLRHALG